MITPNALTGGFYQPRTRATVYGVLVVRIESIATRVVRWPIIKLVKILILIHFLNLFAAREAFR